MQIFVDADACPVVGIVEKVAKEHSVPVTLLCDTNENIDQMLMERHLNKKARRASGKNHLKGPRKRTAEDDEHFRASFEKMIHMALDKEK